MTRPKIISIMQPAYLPWMGYFDRIDKADLHVILDHVTLGKDGASNRNKIRSATGEQMLTVPIKNRGGPQAIRDIEICNERNWTNKHFQAIWSNYCKAPFFADHMDFFSDIYRREWTMLCPLIREINDYFLDVFKITTPMVYSSDITARGSKSELNLNICKELGATKYLSGPFGITYLDQPSFAEAGIELEFHHHPPSLSAIDHIFHKEGFRT